MVSVEIPVRWGDMDAYGHINNVAIARVMEEARVMVFGLPSGTGVPGALEPVIDLNSGAGDEVMTLISEHTIRYRGQLPYRGLAVPVEIEVEKIKGASVEISYKIFDLEESESGWQRGRECVRATSTMVFVSAVTGAPVRVSAEQRAALENAASETTN